MSLRITALFTALVAVVGADGETLLPEGGQIEVPLPEHLEEAQARVIAANLHMGALAAHCVVRDADRDRVRLVAIRPCDCFGQAITREAWKALKPNAQGRVEVPVLASFGLPGTHRQRLQLAELLRTGALVGKLSLAVRVVDPEAEAIAKADAAKREAAAKADAAKREAAAKADAAKAEAEAKRLADEEAKRQAELAKAGGKPPAATGQQPPAGGNKDPLVP